MSLSLADKQKGFISCKITGFKVKERIKTKHQKNACAYVEKIEQFVKEGKVKQMADYPTKLEPTMLVPTPQVFSLVYLGIIGISTSVITH